MKYIIIAFSVLGFLGKCPAAETSPLKLWYDQPARDWMTQALPIGNGRLGGMIFGGADTERAQFKEISLGPGDEKDTGAYQDFGDLFIDFDGTNRPVSDYRRELDLSKAVHRVQYAQNGVQER